MEKYVCIKYLLNTNMEWCLGELKNIERLIKIINRDPKDLSQSDFYKIYEICYETTEGVWKDNTDPNDFNFKLRKELDDLLNECKQIPNS